MGGGGWVVAHQILLSALGLGVVSILYFLLPRKVKTLVNFFLIAEMGEKWLSQIFTPPFFTRFFFQNDLEWLEMDFKQCNILTHETPPMVGVKSNPKYFQN